MKKLIPFVLLVIIAGGLGYFVMQPFMVSDQIGEAIAVEDTEAFESHVELEMVRESLKGQVKARANKTVTGAEQPTSALGGIFSAVTGSLVGVAVDKMVTPKGVADLIGARNEPEEIRAAFASASKSYQSLDRFVVVFREDDGRELTCVLSRMGLLEWKLTDIRLPEEAE